MKSKTTRPNFPAPGGGSLPLDGAPVTASPKAEFLPGKGSGGKPPRFPNATMSTLRHCLFLMVTTPLLQAQEGGILAASTADAGAVFAGDTGLYQTLRHADEFINAGRQGTAGVFHQAAVIPFQLPDFGMVVNPFAGASFTFRCVGKQNTSGSFNVDLYGLAPRPAATVLPEVASGTDLGDYYMGPNDPAPGVVKIQDNILTNAIPSGTTVTSNEAGSAALADYLNASYRGGAGARSWVFLRLCLDGVPGGVNRYAIASADASTEAHRPFITYEKADISVPPRLTITPATAPATGFILEWNSQAEKLYNLRTNTDFDSPIADWDLLKGGIEATPPANVEQVDPADPRRFYAVEEFDAPPPPPIFSADFEDDGGGFATSADAGTAWAWGTPDSAGPGGTVTAGSGAEPGSGKCWGTGIGNPGFYANPTTNSRLISAVIDLTSVAAAKLGFAHAIDLEASDSAVVRLFNADTSEEIVSGDFPLTVTDADATAAHWQTSGPHILPVGAPVRIEWAISGSGGAANDFMGWYIDDVVVTAD